MNRKHALTDLSRRRRRRDRRHLRGDEDDPPRRRRRRAGDDRRSAQIAHRTRALDRTEAALRKALSQQPPKLPAAPGGDARPGGRARSRRAAGRVVYVRPAPIVHTSTAPAASTRATTRPKAARTTAEAASMTNHVARLYALVARRARLLRRLGGDRRPPVAGTLGHDARTRASRRSSCASSGSAPRRSPSSASLDRRWAAYRAQLALRKQEIAAVQKANAKAASLASVQSSPSYSAAPAVRVVTLPPLTITRTS